MASQEEIRSVRLQKLALLREKGLNPYPISTKRDATLAEVVSQFDELAKRPAVSVAGRVMSLRPQGALIFITLNDGASKFQGLIKKAGEVAEVGTVSAEVFDLFSQTVDIGDFVELSGGLFVTKRGEKTVAVANWRMLSKSLRPLPEKWHGLQDIDERFRHRYLDTLMDESVRARFVARAKIVSEIRRSLDAAGYLEVETPALQPLAGGTNATPFITHHKALDTDLFLRIAPELYLKKLLVGGFPKVYEIGRNFRNEGIDTTHNPEFTMLEYYEAYSDASQQMVFAESLLRNVVEKACGGLTVTFDEEVLDFSKPFARMTYADLLGKYAGIAHPETLTLEQARAKAAECKVKVDPKDPLEKIIDNIYKKACRPKIVQPTFIVDYPVAFLPLAKRSEENPALVNAFQLVAGGMELVKAFSELNDPIDQKSRFMDQEKNAKAGDDEAQPNDEEYLEAMEYGMPPAGGVGVGIDRLTMLLTGMKNIKEVILFPTLKPKGE